MDKQQTVELIFVHGFWGEPKDWEVVTTAIAKTYPASLVRLHNLDLYAQGTFLGFKDWCSRWSKMMRGLDPSSYKIGVGYSMGGRLLRVADADLAVSHGLFLDEMLLLSTHPGDQPGFDETTRRHWESEWSQRFISWPWDQLEEAWSEQEVFRATAKIPHRRGLFGVSEDAFRMALAHSLCRLGLVEQRKYMEVLSLKGDMPRCSRVTWLLGEQDLKFASHFEHWRKHVPGEWGLVSGSGHRIFVDAPGVVIEHVNRAIGRRL